METKTIITGVTAIAGTGLGAIGLLANNGNIPNQAFTKVNLPKDIRKRFKEIRESGGTIVKALAAPDEYYRPVIESYPDLQTLDGYDKVNWDKFWVKRTIDRSNSVPLLQQGVGDRGITMNFDRLNPLNSSIRRNQNIVVDVDTSDNRAVIDGCLIDQVADLVAVDPAYVVAMGPAQQHCYHVRKLEEIEANQKGPRKAINKAWQKQRINKWAFETQKAISDPANYVPVQGVIKSLISECEEDPQGCIDSLRDEYDNYTQDDQDGDIPEEDPQ